MLISFFVIGVLLAVKINKKAKMKPVSILNNRHIEKDGYVLDRFISLYFLF